MFCCKRSILQYRLVVYDVAKICGFNPGLRHPSVVDIHIAVENEEPDIAKHNKAEEIFKSGMMFQIIP